MKNSRMMSARWLATMSIALSGLNLNVANATAPCGDFGECKF